MDFLLRATFFRAALVAGLVLFFLFSPYDFKERDRKRRESQTQRADTALEFAAVWPRNNHDLFMEGAELAVEEINRRGGVIIDDEHGYPVPARLKMHEFDEYGRSSVTRLAEDVVANPRLSAVIGHSSPEAAILASVTYHDHGVLFISPSVSDNRLIQLGFENNVQTIPVDREMVRALVAFGLERGWHKAAILHARNSYGATGANLLRSWMGELHAIEGTNTQVVSKMSLVFQDHYGLTENNFYPLIAALLKHPFDVLFLADSLIGDSAPRTLTLLAQLREMGVTQPIVGTEEIHSKLLWPALGQRANGIFAANIFDLQSSKTNKIASYFRSSFRAAYTNLPTMQGSKSYEAVMLLAQAAERARSKVPIKMATMFRSTSDWNGLQGERAYDFSVDGGILRKRVILEQMKDGTFVPPELPRLYTVHTNALEQPMRVRRY